MHGLTKRQSEILKFLENYIHQHGYSPSYREIMSHFGINSLGAIHSHIHALKKKGMIEHLDGKNRSIGLTKSLEERHRATYDIELPLIGYISSGKPLELFPHSQSVTVPQYLVQDPEVCYVLRAKGDTLNEEMVQHGDLLIIEARQEVEDGETALLLINQKEIYLKKYFQAGIHVKLQSHHASTHQIILKEESVQVQGALNGLIRIYL